MSHIFMKYKYISIILGKILEKFIQNFAIDFSYIKIFQWFTLQDWQTSSEGKFRNIRNSKNLRQFDQKIIQIKFRYFQKTIPEILIFHEKLRP